MVGDNVVERQGKRWCRECARLWSREQWGEERREYQRQYRAAHPGRDAAYARAAYARRKAERERSGG